MSQFWIDSALSWAAPVAAWMLTYLLHSTLLLGLAAATGWFLGERRPALLEVVWKCALLGGLATATLQAGLGWTPLAGSWQLPVASERAGAGSPSATTIPYDPVPAVRSAVTGPAIGTTGAVDPTVPAAAPRGTALSAFGGSWPLLAVAAWLAVALALTLRLASDYLRLLRSLRERWPVTDGAVAALFGRMLGKSGRRRPVGLTGSERLPVPIAWGLTRPEVSLPARVLRDLSPYHQESILAHELAHVLRRDPAWLVVARLVEAGLFFQPLNRLARRRLQEVAELRCDDRAVDLTGKPHELARCLTEVATWRLAGSAALPVPSMASGSSLGRRVRRLVEGDRDERLAAWVRPTALAVVLAVAVAAPGVSRGKPAVEEPETAPVTAAAPTEAEVAPAPAPAAAAQPKPWVIVDGRSWDELTPAERDDVRREVAEARRQAASAAREAGDHARRALEQAQHDLRRQRHAHQGAEGSLPLAGLSGLIGGSVQLGLTAASAALTTVDLPAIHAEVARAMAEVERELARERPRIEAEVARAMAEVERELARERPRIEAEVARAMAEVERELAREMPRIQAEIAAATAVVERQLAAEMPRIEAEIERALAEVERELAEIEAEIEAHDLDDEDDP